MCGRACRLVRRKGGITLVEVLVAAALLVLLIAAIIAVISFSNSLLGKNIVSENAYTEAEGIADVLISALSGGTTDQTTLEGLTNAQQVASFTDTPNARQFLVADYTATENGLTIRGYKITVQIYDEKGAVAATITAFASKPRTTTP